MALGTCRGAVFSKPFGGAFLLPFLKISCPRRQQSVSAKMSARVQPR